MKCKLSIEQRKMAITCARKFFVCGDVGGVSSKHIGAVTLQRSVDWILDFTHTIHLLKGLLKRLRENFGREHATR